MTMQVILYTRVYDSYMKEAKRLTDYLMMTDTQTRQSFEDAKHYNTKQEKEFKKERFVINKMVEIHHCKRRQTHKVLN